MLTGGLGQDSSCEGPSALPVITMVTAQRETRVAVNSHDNEEGLPLLWLHGG